MDSTEAVALVGAGSMGSDGPSFSPCAGLDVRLYDSAPAMLWIRPSAIRLRLEELVRHGLLEADPAELLARIHVNG